MFNTVNTNHANFAPFVMPFERTKEVAAKKSKKKKRKMTENKIEDSSPLNYLKCETKRERERERELAM